MKTQTYMSREKKLLMGKCVCYQYTGIDGARKKGSL